MNISIVWHGPFELEDGDEENRIFTTDEHLDFEGIPGVYMFCRQYSGKLNPLYVGKAKGLANRLHHQFNNLKLMKAIQKAGNGAKVLVIGEFKGKPGQSADKCIKSVEMALINHAQTKGHDLFNVQGTRTPKHEITFTGNRLAKAFSGPKMLRKMSGS
jgi:hypothetical protein